MGIEIPTAKYISKDFFSYATILSFAALLFIGVLFFREIYTQTKADYWAQHSYIVVQELEKLLSLVLDAETGQNGYILTGKPEFLEPYNSALKALDRQMQNLTKLTKDNPRQQKRVESIYALIKMRLNILKNRIDIRREKGFEAAQKAIVLEMGKQVMDDIRLQIAQAQNEERDLLEKRKSAETVAMRRTIYISIFGGLAALTILFLAFARLNLTNTELRRHQEHLDELVQARTAELAKINADLAAQIKYSRMTEEALRTSEAHFRLASESADIGVWSFNFVDGTATWGPKCSNLLGLEEHAKPSREIFLNCVHPDDRRGVDEEIENTISNKSDYDVQFRVVWPDYSVHWLMAKGRVLLDEKGQPVRMFGIMMDITRRKHYEERLEAAKNQLENKTKELETIISIVSHDLRAPLVNVKGFSNEIMRDCEALNKAIYAPMNEKNKAQIDKILTKHIPESLRFIKTSAEAMDNLAVSLVNVARAGLGPIKPEQLDMNQLVQNALATIKFKTKNMNVNFSIESELHSCYGDKTQVSQIFTNLLDNAVKYLDPQRAGEVRVTSSVKDGDAIYCVSDNGIGIEAGDQDRIFDPYFQLHEKSAGGVGVGLTTVKRMVERNNGKIWLESEKGKGCTFCISLPLKGLKWANGQ